jgi:hypothetical protein
VGGYENKRLPIMLYTSVGWLQFLVLEPDCPFKILICFLPELEL